VRVSYTRRLGCFGVHSSHADSHNHRLWRSSCHCAEATTQNGHRRPGSRRLLTTGRPMARVVWQRRKAVPVAPCVWPKPCGVIQCERRQSERGPGSLRSRTRRAQKQEFPHFCPTRRTGRLGQDGVRTRPHSFSATAAGKFFGRLVESRFGHSTRWRRQGNRPA
jgi:hypothetical protein